jgi:hypothetical protein
MVGAGGGGRSGAVLRYYEACTPHNRFEVLRTSSRQVAVVVLHFSIWKGLFWSKGLSLANTSCE